MGGGFLFDNSFVFRLLLLLVALAPLPLGGQRPLAWTLLALAVGLLLVAWAVGVQRGAARAAVPLRRLALPLVLVAVALAWAVAQTLAALPPDIHHPLWEEAARTLDRPVVGIVSVDPALTWTAVLRLLCYGGVFWLAVQLGRDRARARSAVLVCALAAAAYAVYGLAAHFSGAERILWMEKWAYLDSLTATFVNRNTFGAYAGLGLLCCLALFLQAARPLQSSRPLRPRDFVDTLVVRALPFLVLAAILGTALLLSQSRGALLATGVGVVVLILAATAGRILNWRAALLFLAFAAPLALLLVGTSGEGTVQRLAETAGQVGEEARLQLYRQAVVAAGDAPWTGHGFGAFFPAFRMYRDVGLPFDHAWDFAHNTHLEMVVDLGLPAALSLYAAFLTIVVQCARGLVQRRRDQIHPALALACAALLGVHGAVDFSAQIPAVAITFALLLGVGFAQSWRSSPRLEEEPEDGARAAVSDAPAGTAAPPR